MKSNNALHFSVFILIFIMIHIHHQGFTATNNRLVLLPLVGTGLNESEKQAYQAALEDALSIQYEVFSGNQVIEALKKQTEFTCTAESCMENIAIEFQGELVGRGTVTSEKDGSYILIIKIKNVIDDKVVFSKSQGCPSCSINDVITILKQMILGKQTPVFEQIRSPGGPLHSEIVRITPETSGDNDSSVAMVILESQPDGADVYLGDALSGQTPYKMSKLKAGQYLQFTLKKKDYHPKTVAVRLKGGINDLKMIHLKPRFGRLIIRSEPSEAEIYIAGKHVGQTPYINHKYPSGVVLVSITKELYRPMENKRVIIRDEETTTKNYHLEANFGVLIVESDPESSNVRLYGSKKQAVISNKTPCEIKTQPGQYTLKISHPGYEDLVYQVRIATNSTKRITKEIARLRQKTGQIMVTCDPFKRGASIYFNDEKMGNVPQDFKLPVGAYTVKIKHKHLTGSQKIRVNDRKTLNVDVELKSGQNWSSTNKLGLSKRGGTQKGSLYVDRSGVVHISRNELQNSMRNINHLMSQLRIRPHFNRGSPDGLSVNNIERGSIFSN